MVLALYFVLAAWQCHCPKARISQSSGQGKQTKTGHMHGIP